MSAAAKEITATDANREFSRLLRAVEKGDTYVVTSRGRKIAKVTPYADDWDRQADIADFVAFLKSRPILTGEPWAREELYER